ncbi:metal ABC transporter permease [Photobacterium sanguinicancri]|uniref:metal ABC transporter permease n=1 Tax=Photobacterium sanguinicancri TaxID=875932 RepID=UPI0026E24292|nr:metal ABC transporter permease [Photobacterium sanguinicancri]MDO6501136.1 metal ABC transporter permease [Photobacterium sanguinicancri]
MSTEFYTLFIEPFSDFSFMQRALWGCVVLSLSATPIGVFLTLRRMSLTGDAMAHAILPGAAIGFLISGLSVSAMTIGGVVAGCIVAVLAGIVARHSHAEEDSSMAAFYLLSLATGVLIISSKGSNVDLLHVLFGSTLALNDEALILLTSIATISMLMLAILYRPIVMECVDPAFFRTVSKLSSVAHYSFLLLVVLNLVAGFHALGTLMAVGLMILPAAIARFWTARLGVMLVIAFFASVVSCYFGLFLSYHASLATSPAIVLVLGGMYIVSLLIGRHGGLLLKQFAN